MRQVLKNGMFILHVGMRSCWVRLLGYAPFVADFNRSWVYILTECFNEFPDKYS